LGELQAGHVMCEASGSNGEEIQFLKNGSPNFDQLMHTLTELGKCQSEAQEERDTSNSESTKKRKLEQKDEDFERMAFHVMGLLQKSTRCSDEGLVQNTLVQEYLAQHSDDSESKEECPDARQQVCDVIEFLITKMHWIVILTADEVCDVQAHARASRFFLLLALPPSVFDSIALSIDCSRHLALSPTPSRSLTRSLALSLSMPELFSKCNTLVTLLLCLISSLCFSWFCQFDNHARKVAPSPEWTMPPAHSANARTNDLMDARDRDTADSKKRATNRAKLSPTPPLCAAPGPVLSTRPELHASERPKARSVHFKSGIETEAPDAKFSKKCLTKESRSLQGDAYNPVQVTVFYPGMVDEQENKVVSKDDIIKAWRVCENGIRVRGSFGCVGIIQKCLHTFRADALVLSKHNHRSIIGVIPNDSLHGLGIAITRLHTIMLDKNTSSGSHITTSSDEHLTFGVKYTQLQQWIKNLVMQKVCTEHAATQIDGMFEASDTQRDLIKQMLVDHRSAKSQQAILSWQQSGEKFVLDTINSSGEKPKVWSQIIRLKYRSMCESKAKAHLSNIYLLDKFRKLSMYGSEGICHALPGLSIGAMLMFTVGPPHITHHFNLLVLIKTHDGMAVALFDSLSEYTKNNGTRIHRADSIRYRQRSDPAKDLFELVEAFLIVHRNILFPEKKKAEFEKIIAELEFHKPMPEYTQPRGSNACWLFVIAVTKKLILLPCEDRTNWHKRDAHALFDQIQSNMKSDFESADEQFKQYAKKLQMEGWIKNLPLVSGESVHVGALEDEGNSAEASSGLQNFVPHCCDTAASQHPIRNSLKRKDAGGAAADMVAQAAAAATDIHGQKATENMGANSGGNCRRAASQSNMGANSGGICRRAASQSSRSPAARAGAANNNVEKGMGQHVQAKRDVVGPNGSQQSFSQHKNTEKMVRTDGKAFLDGERKLTPQKRECPSVLKLEAEEIGAATDILTRLQDKWIHESIEGKKNQLDAVKGQLASNVKIYTERQMKALDAELKNDPLNFFSNHPQCSVVIYADNSWPAANNGEGGALLFIVLSKTAGGRPLQVLETYAYNANEFVSPNHEKVNTKDARHFVFGISHEATRMFANFGGMIPGHSWITSQFRPIPNEDIRRTKEGAQDLFSSAVSICVDKWKGEQLNHLESLMEQMRKHDNHVDMSGLLHELTHLNGRLAPTQDRRYTESSKSVHVRQLPRNEDSWMTSVNFSVMHSADSTHAKKFHDAFFPCVHHYTLLHATVIQDCLVGCARLWFARWMCLKHNVRDIYAAICRGTHASVEKSITFHPSMPIGAFLDLVAKPASISGGDPHWFDTTLMYYYMLFLSDVLATPVVILSLAKEIMSSADNAAQSVSNHTLLYDNTQVLDLTQLQGCLFVVVMQDSGIEHYDPVLFDYKRRDCWLERGFMKYDKLPVVLKKILTLHGNTKRDSIEYNVGSRANPCSSIHRIRLEYTTEEPPDRQFHVSSRIDWKKLEPHIVLRVLPFQQSKSNLPLKTNVGLSCLTAPFICVGAAGGHDEVTIEDDCMKLFTAPELKQEDYDLCAEILIAMARLLECLSTEYSKSSVRTQDIEGMTKFITLALHGQKTNSKDLVIHMCELCDIDDLHGKHTFAGISLDLFFSLYATLVDRTIVVANDQTHSWDPDQNTTASDVTGWKYVPAENVFNVRDNKSKTDDSFRDHGPVQFVGDITRIVSHLNTKHAWCYEEHLRLKRADLLLSSADLSRTGMKPCITTMAVAHNARVGLSQCWFLHDNALHFQKSAMSFKIHITNCLQFFSTSQNDIQFLSYVIGWTGSVPNMGPGRRPSTLKDIAAVVRKALQAEITIWLANGGPDDCLTIDHTSSDVERGMVLDRWFSRQQVHFLIKESCNKSMHA